MLTDLLSIIGVSRMRAAPLVDVRGLHAGTALQPLATHPVFVRTLAPLGSSLPVEVRVPAGPVADAG